MKNPLRAKNSLRMKTRGLPEKKNLQPSLGKEDAIKTGRFVLYFILVYLLASMALEVLLPARALEAAVANNVLFLLGAAGQGGSVSSGETAVIALAGGAKIEISELCTGRMETLIIFSAIIASAGIAWRKRLAGAAIAAAAAIAFNHLRIAGTALLILGSGDTAMIEFAHNILFRVFLFIVIAGFYIGWFYWAASGELKPAHGKNAATAQKIALRKD